MAIAGLKDSESVLEFKDPLAPATRELDDTVGAVPEKWNHDHTVEDLNQLHLAKT
ncbi:hypothetical protein SUNI508_00900 [Seiridium unicorne]|uniref:Uncharacterized protein n=1 Tax=Seiridium unicorne TaxID=138068 RepID=A0ABR2V2K6_9PEZI